FETEEEERLIFLDGSTQCSTKLVLYQWRTRKPVKIGKVVIGIQNFVPQIFVSCTVKVIGSGFGGDVNHTSRIVPILRTNIISHYAKLLHYVLRRDVGGEVVGRPIGGNTVHIELTLVSETSTNCVVPKADCVRSRPTRLVRDCIAVGAALCHHSRHQCQHIVHVSSA